jgi:hypothetical protein
MKLGRGASIFPFLFMKQFASLAGYSSRVPLSRLKCEVVGETELMESYGTTWLAVDFNGGNPIAVWRTGFG